MGAIKPKKVISITLEVPKIAKATENFEIRKKNLENRRTTTTISSSSSFLCTLCAFLHELNTYMFYDFFDYL